MLKEKYKLILTMHIKTVNPRNIYNFVFESVIFLIPLMA